MYHQSSKRRQILMRTLVYTLMTVSVVAIVTVLMLIILGYSFNRQDGRLEQGGLLQFSSMPSGASVTLDGVQMGSRTPSKANVDAKSHNVQMNLKNYRPWQKTITVEAGNIGWLSYARLVPTDITTEQLHSFPSLSASLASQSRKWIITQQTAADSTFMLINIESDTPKYTDIAIPETLITPAATDAPQVIKLVAWSKSDDRILVQRTYDESKVEWIVLDRQNPDTSINISSKFAIQATDVQFGVRNGSNAYVLTSDGVVRLVNLSGSTLSAPLADNISEYSVYDSDTLLFVTHPDEASPSERTVGYHRDGMETPQQLFRYPADTENVHVAFGEYYGKKYVAVTHGMTLDVFRGDLPRGTNKGSLKRLTRVTLDVAPQLLTIGSSGRFVTAEQPDSYTVYDIELAKKDTTPLTRPSGAPRKLQWLDGYLIASDRAGTLRLYEFDGGNQQDIMPVIEGHAMSLSSNEKYLYGFREIDGGGVGLVRANMRVN